MEELKNKIQAILLQINHSLASESEYSEWWGAARVSDLFRDQLIRKSLVKGAFSDWWFCKKYPTSTNNDLARTVFWTSITSRKSDYRPTVDRVIGSLEQYCEKRKTTLEAVFS